MKKLVIILLLPIFLFPFLSFDKKSGADLRKKWIGRPIALLPNKTLDGKVIDENYYKGHVTIVSFMYLLCPPCMNEISTLNKLKRDYSGNKKLQILCVARQISQQMEDFNSTNKTMFSQMRAALGVDSIEYTIQPACTGSVSKMTGNTGNDGDKNVTLKSECSTIEDTYGFNAFPVIFLVDKNGIIKGIHDGGPGKRNDTAFYNELKQDADSLLATE